MKKNIKFLGAIFIAAILFSSHRATAEEVLVADGKNVSFEYTLTVEGQEVDSSKEHGPLQYVHGEGKIIPGLEKQLAGLKVGDEKTVTVAPEEAYGMSDPGNVKEIQRSLIPADINLAVGTTLEMTDKNGNVFPTTVKEIKENTVLLDFNHPLAGKQLTFQIKIVDIK